MEKKILKNTQIISLGLFFKKEKILAIGDLHLGQEEELNKQGILVPRKNFEKVKKEFEYILKKTKKLKKIVLLGDIKHEFGKASTQEWQEIIELAKFLKKNCDELILIKGNHDNTIKSITNWLKIKLVEKFEINDYCFCHGNKIMKTSKKNIIIGHEHSAIILTDNYKKEKFKCIIKIIHKNKKIIVLPSFNFLNIGTDILTEKLISPYLKNKKIFETWVLEKRKNFYFGKLIKK